ncbi:MAG TPA: hypothetical protein VM802_27385 [Chitinophaga sp.]|uniref:hypothetical protein n=1 Tax=Chitinophaga sp. TaxID=1869181 RepID=UPI002C9AD044|nr:hypothetical protein [Chitinophaga sp.]HVI48622.1 hypothetical protein [Chitinophaga sp.]
MNKYFLPVLIALSVPVALSAQTNRVEKDGFLGIGTTTPAAPLHIINGKQEIKFGTGTNTSAYSLSLGLNDDGINFDINSSVRAINFRNIGNMKFSLLPDGNLLIDRNGDVSLYTGTAAVEQNRYLALMNSQSFTSASGLKAGGVLVSGDFSFASPGKNDLVVKGNTGMGVPAPKARLDIAGGSPWTTNGWGKAIKLANANTIEFTGLQRSFGIGTTQNILYFFHANADGTGGANYFMMADGTTGNVGIGTVLPPGAGYKLAVEGTIGARKVKVTQGSWADFVFADDYKLLPLKDVKNFIDQHKHLPDIPSAKEVAQEGLDVGEMNKKLLQKVEELTLHLIAESKRNDELQEEVKQLRTVTSSLGKQVFHLQQKR